MLSKRFLYDSILTLTIINLLFIPLITRKEIIMNMQGSVLCLVTEHRLCYWFSFWKSIKSKVQLSGKYELIQRSVCTQTSAVSSRRWKFSFPSWAKHEVSMSQERVLDEKTPKHCRGKWQLTQWNLPLQCDSISLVTKDKGRQSSYWSELIQLA